MKNKIKNNNCSIDEYFDLLGIDVILSDNDLEKSFLDSNGNYTYSFDLKMDSPNQVMNSGLVTEIK